MMDKNIIYDAIVIGAGPGGLTAAIYLKRDRRNILVIHNQQSRAALIPKTHNYPGFPKGISGKGLLARLKKQFFNYDTHLVKDNILNLDKKKKIFIISGKKNYFSKKVILATGIRDIEPSLPNLENAIRKGLIRHCPLCDAYEVIDQKIAIIGKGEKGIKEALFLRDYSDSVILFTLGSNLKLGASKIQQLKERKIKIVSDPIFKVIMGNKKIIALITQKGNIYYFDTLYSSLGTVVNSYLATKLGAEHIRQYLKVNQQQETTVKGLFAIGDIVPGINQICVASAQGAIAATAIHNQLK